MLKEFFPSWYDVKRHEEVVKFTVGLMSDPTLLVRHVYEMYIEWILGVMRTGQRDIETEDMLHRLGINVHDRALFTSMYRESKIQLPDHPLNNQYINYYTHEDNDDNNKRPRNTTQIYTPSRLYYFNNMKKLIASDEHREEHDEIPDCAVIINKPAVSVTRNLLSAIRNISQQQRITNLQVVDVQIDDRTKADIFNMSQNALSLHARNCDLPSGVIKNLLQQLNHCKRMTRLQVLGLRDCKMPQDVSLEVIKSLTACKHLTKLSLSGNTLGAGGCHLADSITSWSPYSSLQQLGLEDCRMPQDASVYIVKSLSGCKHLTHLFLSGNTFGAGGYHLTDSITSWAPYPSLQRLGLRDCMMPQDASVHIVKSLSACEHLTHLFLSGNTLGAGGCHLADSITTWDHCRC